MINAPGILSLLLFATPALSAAGGAGESDALPPRTPAQQQVITELLRQPMGPATLDALNLPEPYLRRVADRIIQSSFEQRFRIVVRDQGVTSADTASAQAEGIPSSKTPETTQPVRSRAYAWLPVGIGAAVILIAGILLALRKGGDAQ